MERCVSIEIGGKIYPMRMSLAAHEWVNKTYGSIKGMTERFGDEKRCIGTYLDVAEVLIAQGCAYKNMFEADMPVPENAPVKDDKWIPISREGIALGIDRCRMGELIKAIADAAGLAIVNEISGKASTKKNEKAELSEKT